MTDKLDYVINLLEQITKEIEEYNNSDLADEELEESLEFEREFAIRLANNMLEKGIT